MQWKIVSISNLSSGNFKFKSSKASVLRESMVEPLQMIAVLLAYLHAEQLAMLSRDIL